MMLTATADLDMTLGRIVVDTPYRCKDAVKAVPGSRWDTDLRVWTTPVAWSACLALRAEYGAGLIIGDELRAWAMDVVERKSAVTEARNSLIPLEPLPFLPGFAGLLPYQGSDALSIARAAGQFLVLNETGTGKTRSVAAGLSLLQDRGHDIFPAIVVAPKSVVINWERELRIVFPDAKINICQGTPTKVRKALTPGDADIYLIGWDALKRYSRIAPFGSVKLTDDQKIDKEIQALGLRTFVGDEIHRAKNCKSIRTRAAWAVAHPCQYRIGLTGTPIQETPEDMFGILHTLFPEEYPNKTSFVKRYLNESWNMWGGRDIDGINPAHEVEFFQNYDTLSRRLTKTVVAPWLPDKLQEDRWVELPSKLRKAYDEMKLKMIAQLEDGTMPAESAMVQTGRLIQLANSWGSMDADGKFHMEMPSPKVEAFMEDALDGDFDGHQVVVFSDSRQLIDLLAEQMTKKKLGYVIITGDVTGSDRQAAVDAFQAGEAQFCLLTRAGGEGITLTAADIMVRLMRPWSYTVHTQVEDRVHRLGSEKHEAITYIDYITADTVEVGQRKRLVSKGAAAQEVLRDAEILDLLKGTI